MTTLLMSKIRAAVVVAALAVPSGSTALYAQYQNERIQVNIPFAFEVGSAHFAPGTYFLSEPEEYFLSVRGPSGTALVMNRREASLSPAKARLSSTGTATNTSFARCRSRVRPIIFSAPNQRLSAGLESYSKKPITRLS